MFDRVLLGRHLRGLPNCQTNLDAIVDLVEWRDLLSLVSRSKFSLRSIQIYDLGFPFYGYRCKLDCGVCYVMDDGEVDPRSVNTSLWKLDRVALGTDNWHPADRCR